jgi:predicted transposase YbfD/YdcC
MTIVGYSQAVLMVNFEKEKSKLNDKLRDLLLIKNFKKWILSTKKRGKPINISRAKAAKTHAGFRSAARIILCQA